MRGILGRRLRLVCSFLLTSLSAALPSSGHATPFAYVANFGSPPTVSVVDLATESVVATIPAPDGTDPYWVGVSRNGKTVAVTLHDNTGVLLIDGRTNTLLGVVGGVGNEPEGVAVDSSGNTVYVADEDPSGSDGDLYVVDVASKSVRAGPIPIDEIDGSTVCDEPENIVISPDHRFLYIACAGTSVIRVDTTTFEILVVAEDTDDAHGVALSCDGTKLYYGDESVESGGSAAFEWDTGTESLTGKVFADCDFYNGAVSPDGRLLYCVEESSSVKIYDTESGDLLEEIALGSCCSAGVAPHPSLPRAYATVSGLDLLQILDVSALESDGTIAVGDGPRGVGIASCGAAAPRPVPALGAPAAVLALFAFVLLGAGRAFVGPRVSRGRRPDSA